MRHIDYRDLAAGVLLLALGLFVALYAGAHYRVGEAARMGPGFFPAALGWVLAALGLAIGLLAFRKSVQALQPPRFAWRPLLAILAAILAFGLVVERLGLVPAAVALTGVAVFAEKPLRWRRTFWLAVGLSLLCWLIFSVALQMSLPAFRLPG
ncbi:MAG: tripartite tricarboxylate transporter TctB family protein [Burkholderiaceae bacterium]